ncbi:MAG: tRNA (N(6)-L-threonylcarbamoyladenosine(37)-C(2))-methylthiotransferase MtaB [Clostridiales bacterium]|nr:tRNA (N(6)-L-threonylcarbamoyladenosine(37)-C(2))-methylthiotransferase MtaB [Clostridiales bacterium]
MRVSFCTLGCKVNQYETVIMEQDFTARGYEIVPFGEKTDVTVINTCAVTEESARKSRQMMRRAKKISPETVTVVVGCLSQTEGVEKLAEADVIVGSKLKRSVPRFVDEFLMSGRRVIAVESMAHENEFEPMKTDRGERTRAQIKIQDGCNNFCSYCIIPYARGRIRSKEMTEAVEEAASIVKNGYKEIVLTGIHLDSYGKEHGRFGLCDLLERLDGLEGLERVRLGSLEPLFVSEENVARLRRLRTLCPHFHLSLQSGSDDVLKAMNRHYTTAEYFDAVRRLRDSFGEVSVTTDIITGFPSETEYAHKRSLAFAEKVGFAKIHVFPFSPRKGTKAYDMKDQVSADVKKRRTSEMLEVAKNSSEAFYDSKVGKEESVLFEHRKNGLFVGLTPDYAEVRVKAERDISNTVLPVRIISADGESCLGELVNNGGNDLG